MKYRQPSTDNVDTTLTKRCAGRCSYARFAFHKNNAFEICYTTQPWRNLIFRASLVAHDCYTYPFRCNDAKVAPSLPRSSSYCPPSCWFCAERKSKADYVHPFYFFCCAVIVCTLAMRNMIHQVLSIWNTPSNQSIDVVALVKSPSSSMNLHRCQVSVKLARSSPKKLLSPFSTEQQQQ